MANSSSGDEGTHESMSVTMATNRIGGVIWLRPVVTIPYKALGSWLYKKLTKPTSEFSEWPVSVAQERSIKVLFSIPNDLIFAHLLANVGNNRFSDGLAKRILCRARLNEGIHRLGAFGSNRCHVCEQYCVVDTGKPNHRNTRTKAFGIYGGINHTSWCGLSGHKLATSHVAIKL